MDSPDFLADDPISPLFPAGAPVGRRAAFAPAFAPLALPDVADMPTRVVARARAADATVLPAYEPDAPADAALRAAATEAWAPWAVRYSATSRAARLRELAAFLAFCRARYLALPAEVRDAMAEGYAAWLAERVAAGAIGGSTARRRRATVRAALAWRRETLRALSSAAA